MLIIDKIIGGAGRGGANFSPVLILNKLLIFIEATNAQNCGNAVIWYVIGTRNFRVDLNWDGFFGGILLIPILAFAMMQSSLSVCKVHARPSMYLRRVVTIHAQLIVAIPHGAYLLDENCRKNILILGYDLPDADETARNVIGSAMASECSLLEHKTYADFTGKIVYSPKGYPEFRLKAVSNLDNAPCVSLGSK